MNPSHAHLLLTHAPVTATLIALLLLIVAVIRRAEEMKRAALVLLVLTALVGVAGYLTGAPAVEHLKSLLRVTPMDEIDQHAEIAVVALVAVLLVGVVAAAALVWSRKSRSIGRGWIIAVLIAACLSCGLLAWTAQLGGRIRHPEMKAAS